MDKKTNDEGTPAATTRRVKEPAGFVPHQTQPWRYQAPVQEPTAAPAAPRKKRRVHVRGCHVRALPTWPFLEPEPPPWTRRRRPVVETALWLAAVAAGALAVLSGFGCAA